MSKTRSRKLSEVSQGSVGSDGSASHSGNGSAATATVERATPRKRTRSPRGASSATNGALPPNSEPAAATSEPRASDANGATGAPDRRPRGKSVLDVPVNFGDVSIGDGTARIGVRIDRSLLNIDAADELLCGRRLSGRLLVLPPGDASNQTYIDPVVGGDLKHELESTFDVKRFSASPKNITAGLTFSLQEVEVSELSHFAKRGGRLVVAGIEEIPAKQRGRKAKAKAK